MGDGQEARRNRTVALGQVRVAAVLTQDHLALHGVLFLEQPEQIDLGAHHGAIGLVQVEQLQRGIVATVLEPAVDEAAGLALQAAVFQIHGEEGGVRGDIDQAEGVVELNAVEQHHLVINDGGVAQVKIAMAFANEALLTALFEQWLQTADGRFGPVEQGVQLLQIGRFAEQRADLFEVLPHRRDYGFGSAERMVGGHPWGGQVELGDPLGQRIDVSVAQFSAGLHLGHQLRLGEFAHLQHVLDRLAGTIQLGRLDATGNRQHFQIKVGRQALVQAQFFLAEVFAGAQLGEVEEAEIDRLLELVGIGAGQDDPGNMRLDDLETIHRMRV